MKSSQENHTSYGIIFLIFFKEPRYWHLLSLSLLLRKMEAIVSSVSIKILRYAKTLPAYDLKAI